MGPGHLERIFDRVGHFGRFQIFLYFICAFQNISCGIHYLSSVFMTFTPRYTCKPPGNVSQVIFHNLSSWRLEDTWALLSPGQEDHITVRLQDGEIWELSRCSRIRRENISHLDYEYSGTKSNFLCEDGYLYDQSKWKSTVVTEWNLVCDRKWFRILIQPLFMFGVLLGAVIFGHLADRLGRQVILWSTSSGIFLFGVAAAFAVDFYSFMAARFFLAMAASGYLVVGFVYVTEFIGMKSRTWASIHLHSFFAIGVMVVALTGYLVRTWWLYQVILSTVTAPFILCCWMLPETPFWLLSEGRHKEAQRVVDMIAMWNGTNSCKLSEILSLNIDDPVYSSPTAVKKHNLFDLFRDWTVSARTLSVWLVWFTGSLGFYTFSLNSVNLGGNEYLNLFLLGIVEIPAYVFVCIGINSVGRRNMMVFSLFFSSVSCGVIMVIPQDNHVWIVMVTMAAKFAIGSVFGLIYLYTAELYPTVVRSLAVGSGSMVCRVASILAPLSLSLVSSWIFIPQLLTGILAFVSGVLTVNLPETLGKPLITTWEEAAKLKSENNSSSSKLLPTTNNIRLEKVEVINPGDSSLEE
ncbi:solute carrier family 22 member 16 isoform X1 [Cynocephalus volans]|uniref:solute carrier family 22 member 16 isoform X1 n=2 Tax=Cynocephalus volans TaxID=110931 RepID=UPI002FC8A3EB